MLTEYERRDAIRLRPAVTADVELIAAAVDAGVRNYRPLAPAGWEPPSAASHVERVSARFPEAWVLLAFDGNALVGHVSSLPDAEELDVEYLWHLFVDEPWWGTGLATRLMRAFVSEARRRGSIGGRLCTPACQTRARRFYEREGWRDLGEAVLESRLGLELVTYRRTF